MFSFNRNEQIALLLLAGALLIGGVVSIVSRYAADRTPDFEVRKGAVALPPATPDSVLDAQAQAVVAPIDLNRASAKDLQRLPRVGPQTARRIVEYREQNGPFRSLDDLTVIRGIGPKTIDRLRPLATVTRP
jgi:comEA protein